MKLTEARQAYYDFSKSLSDITRNLGLAGIAIIWFFKQQVQNRTVIPPRLHIPGLLIVASLSMDILQYAWSTAAWGTFATLREHQRKKSRERGAEIPDDEDIGAPRWINRVTLVPFCAKVLCLAIAYVGILHFLLNLVW